MDFLTKQYNQINDLIVSYLGELGPLIVAGMLGLLLVLIALPTMLTRQKDPLEKIKAERLGKARPSDMRLRVGGKDERLDRFAQYLEPQDQAEYSAVQMTLIRAGYRSKGAIQMFHFAQFALGIAGLILGTLYVLFAGNGSAQSSIMAVLIPGGVGYYLPKYWVQRRVQFRS